MRYRLKINRTEFLTGLIPMADFVFRQMSPDRHSHNGAHSLWQAFHAGVVPVVTVGAALVVVLQYFFSYVELTPSALEYHAVWRHRSIPYFQIEKIVPGLRIKGEFVRAGVTQVYAPGMKKLSFSLDRQEEFMAELKQYAPQARMEELSA